MMKRFYLISIMLCLMFSIEIFGAVFTRDIKLHDNNGDIVTITIITKVQNGTGFVNVDSSVVSVFPNDTTLALNDSANWIIQWVWDLGAGDTIADDELILFSPTVSVTLSGSGTGSDTIVFYAIDTSDTDTGTQDVKLTVKNASGVSVITGFTDGTGAITFFLDPGAYTIIGRKTGFVWESLAYTVAGSADSVQVSGYDIDVTAPTAPNTANVYLFFVNNDGTPAVGVGISAFLRRGSITDSSGFAYSNEAQYKKTDSNGRVFFTCVWSSYLIPETKWRFTGRAPGIGSFRKDYTVPRQAVDTLNLSE